MAVAPAISLLIYSGINYEDSPQMRWLFMAGVVLYSVCLMATTSGSLAAWRSRSTVGLYSLSSSDMECE